MSPVSPRIQTAFLAQLLAGANLLLFASGAFAVPDTLTLAWNANPEPNITGYRVYLRTSGGEYGAPIATTAGSVTQATIDLGSLDHATTYLFAVTALNTFGVESDFSTEVGIEIKTGFAATASIPVIVSIEGNNSDFVFGLSGPLETTPALYFSNDLETWSTDALAVYGSSDLKTWDLLSATLGASATSIIVNDPKAELAERRIYKVE